MILIGQYDSPFVRRVAVALRHYGLSYEHRAWSTFSDAKAVAAFNPLRRVPVLVLDDGETLIESGAILDHLDGLAPLEERLIPLSAAPRRAVLRLCALATGLCDKMVSLVYERALHEQVSPQWIARCDIQVGAVLDHLEAERSAGMHAFWFGEAMTHGDIAVTCAVRFLREAHSNHFDLRRWPAVLDLSDRCESLDTFSAVVQAFAPPT